MESLEQLAVDVDWTGDDLTLNERIAVEDACGGRPFEEIRAEGRTTYFRALAWVTLRRADARLTLEEAGVLHIRFETAGGS